MGIFFYYFINMEVIIITNNSDTFVKIRLENSVSDALKKIVSIKETTMQNYVLELIKKDILDNLSLLVKGNVNER